MAAVVVVVGASVVVGAPVVVVAGATVVVLVAAVVMVVGASVVVVEATVVVVVDAVVVVVAAVVVVVAAVVVVVSATVVVVVGTMTRHVSKGTGPTKSLRVDSKTSELRVCTSMVLVQPVSPAPARSMPPSRKVLATSSLTWVPELLRHAHPPHATAPAAFATTVTLALTDTLAVTSS